MFDSSSFVAAYKKAWFAGVLLLCAAAPPSMGVKDFLTDQADYVGKSVTVTGIAACLSGSICMLYADVSAPMQAVTFAPDKLSREDRRRLLDCQPFVNQCAVAVTGLVRNTPLEALAASSMTWTP